MPQAFTNVLKPMSHPQLTAKQARCFMQLATGLCAPMASIGQALDHLGFVQIDPINVCGRMQDHILRHRVRGYQEHDLMRHLHAGGTRTAFEHHLPDSGNLAALPLQAWPYLQRSMRERRTTECSWAGELSPAEKKLAPSILSRVAAEGPLCPQDIDSERKPKSYAWDTTSVAKGTMQKLFFHGRLLIARREANRRYYDLPERVLPAAALDARTPSEKETTRWLALLKLRQRRLAVLTRAELREIGDEVWPVTLSDRPGPTLYMLRADADKLDGDTHPPGPILIAPLDPIIYDRRVTESVWSYDYRWEVYVPPQKRIRGYYALPLLHGHRFIGHADLKADRAGGLLNMVGSESTAASHLRTAVGSLAAFLNLDPGK